MNNEIITKDNERIASLLETIEKGFARFEKTLEARHHPSIIDSRFLTDKEVASILQVSRRTMQDYRNNGIVPYVQVGGKILYRESDICRIVENGYRKAFKEV